MTRPLLAFAAAAAIHTAAAAQPVPLPSLPAPSGPITCQAIGCTTWGQRPPQFPHPWQTPVPGPPAPPPPPVPAQPVAPAPAPGLDYGAGGVGYGQGMWLGGGFDSGGVGGRGPMAYPWGGTPGYMPGPWMAPPGMWWTR